MNTPTETDIERTNTDEKVPNEPLAALGYMLEKYRLIEEGNREENTREFLDAGEGVSLPKVIDKDGVKKPYRFFPMGCTNVINACVKVLEEALENGIKGNIAKEDERTRLIGAVCLADMLFAGAATSADGKFSVHWIKKADQSLEINGHGDRIKQLAGRLEKWKVLYTELAKRKGVELEIPALSCRQTVDADIRSSFVQWQGIDPTKWKGEKPWEMTDSLDSLKENKGFEARGDAGAVSGWDSGVEDQLEREAEEIAQDKWIGLPVGKNLMVRDIQRGNILARSPKAWLWTYAEDPLQFAVDFVCNNAVPCLEEAHSLLVKGQGDKRFEEAGSMALVIDSKNRNNPDNFWKIIKRITNHFSSQRGEDPEAMLEKLDCARFTICLAETNRKLGVDGKEFQRIFHEKIHRLMGDPKASETATRNEVLMECLMETSAAKTDGWDKTKAEQWLEHLQSSAVGAYENSVGMEAQRRRLLGKLNHLFKTPREELERIRENPEGHEDTVKKLHKILGSASDALFEYLSGKSGQMTRRELRTKAYSLKEQATRRGAHEVASRLGETGKFLASISSQIKTGDWWKNKDGNKSAIFGFLATMLECPKVGDLEFPGSREPEAKDALEITCDFLAGVCDPKPGMGNHTLAEAIESCQEFENEDEGGKLSSALKKISKTRDRGRGENQTLTGMIGERRKTLEAAISIAREIHKAEDPISALHRRMEEEIGILRSPQDLAPESNVKFEENLYFWKGVHYLAQNIQSRKEEEIYQASSTAKGTLQNVVAIAKAKLKNKDLRKKDGESLKQFGLTKTRERTLLTGLAIPLGLWLEKPEKGTRTKVTHEAFLESLEARRHACEVCLGVGQTDGEIDRLTLEFEDKSRQVKSLANSYLLAEIIGTLENPKELKQGLEWQMEHAKAAAELKEEHPELDTPVKKWGHVALRDSERKMPSVTTNEIG